MKERWKPIKGLEGFYEVSDRGRVRNIGRWVEVKIGRGTNPDGTFRKWIPARVRKDVGSEKGYRIVLRGKRSARSVAILVLEAFRGPKLPGQQCCHWDDDPSNNKLSNLRWDFPKGNAADRIRNGGQVRGERQGSAKLTAEQVLSIRSSTEKSGVLGQRYGVSGANIDRIRKRETWRHL
jgi:hypothetical protein